MDLLSLEQLRQATEGRIQGSAVEATPLRRMVCDSREVRAGDVFWALRGSRRDGAEFVEDAFSRGAWGCVVERGSAAAAQACQALEATVASGPRFLLWVNDTQRALADLARWHRERVGGCVIAVTGSVGKTTTREMIHAVLNRRLRGTRSAKNYNNHLGVPLSLLEVSSRDDYAVLELAASAPGEIAALAAISRPRIGVLTAIGAAHLEGFGNLEGVAQAKGELLEALPPHGLAVLNGEDCWIRAIANRTHCRRTWVGQEGGSDWTASEIRFAPGRLSFTLHAAAGLGPPRRVTVPANGRHMLTAALCAAAVGGEMGLSLEEIVEGLASFRPPPQRCEILEAGFVTIINDCYNASPPSMNAALRLLDDLWQWRRARKATGARRIFVCGDMRELGAQSAHYHRALGREAVGKTDLLLAYGSYAEAVVAGAREAGMAAESAAALSDRDALCRCLLDRIRPGDVVLVKGSRALAMEKVVEELLSASDQPPASDECGIGRRVRGLVEIASARC